jgi:glycosyltransferase involved in cell wall biosynthesis
VKLVFVTRRFPPSMGGMQTLSAQLAREFSNRADTTTIAWGRSQAFLPYFLPSALVKTLYAIAFRGAEHVHLGDALLAPIGVLLRATGRVSVSVTVNGRDIAFDSALYQSVVPRCLARLDTVVCVSRAIADECVRRGVPRERCVVIPNGVDPDELHVNTGRENLARILGRNLDGHHVLVTVGRLVRKKGVEWFVREVMPLLPAEALYVVLGDGPERRAIEDAVKRRGLEASVVLLGAVPHEDPMLRAVYGGADLFVMPNAHVPGDFEGFGIVAVEAASAGLPVVASRVDGIEDAVLEGRTGHLVTPGAAEEFAARIQACFTDEALDRDAVRSAAKDQFGWERIGALYMKAIEDARSSRRAAAAETIVETSDER